MKSIREGKHEKDCVAVRDTKSGRWDYAWAFAEMDWRDYRGKKHGMNESTRSRLRNNRMWLVIPCNDPACSAKLLVKMSDFLKLLPKT